MHILIFVGTRPEAIKMAPVIAVLRKVPTMRISVCTTGQHKEMLTQAFSDFAIVPEYDLAVMTSGQSLAELSAVLFKKIDALLAHIQPDWVLVQGDTSTVMIAALCAFYRQIKVGHVEAGLRSFNNHAPFPEELNRKVTAIAADLHFAPTAIAQENLLREGVAAAKILLTGNTIVDALLWMQAQIRQNPPPLPEALQAALNENKQLVIITGHRRENFGEGFLRICESIRTLADMHPQAVFLYPVHLNPQVRKPVQRLLSGHPRILLTDPFSYKIFLCMMKYVSLLLTDSGGIQEEATIMGKPVLVMRETTERPEGIQAGAALLVGTSPETIIREVSALLTEPLRRESMSHAGKNLYGDGDAALRIRDALLAY